MSGTASIVGSESVHPGDLTAQVEETLRNLDEVVAGGLARNARLTPIKVYLRRAEDLAELKAALEQRWDLEREVLVLEADVCREDLLVEIEGVAGAATAAARERVEVSTR